MANHPARGGCGDPASLAARVGCDVEELPALLTKLSATPAGERRCEALRLFFEEGLTLKTIAERQGVTRSWVSTLVEDGIARLVHARAGRLGIPPALWWPLGLIPMPDEPAGPRTCAQVLRWRGYGRARLAGLHRQLAARGLRMACGCPAVLCEAARRCFAPPKPRRGGPEASRPAPAPRLPAEAFEDREDFTAESFAGWLITRPADHGRFELRAGRVRVLPAPVSPHREAGWAVSHRLSVFARARRLGHVVLRAHYAMPSGDVLSPAVAYLTPDHWVHPPLPACLSLVPELVVDLALPGAAADREERRAIYERNGVREHWLLDVAAQRLRQLVLHDGRFGPERDLAGDDVLESVVVDGLRVPVKALFRQAAALARRSAWPR